MLEGEVLVGELLAVDGLAAGAVAAVLRARQENKAREGKSAGVRTPAVQPMVA